MASAPNDVVIIGGGIAGIATAYYLAKAGIRSTVIEKDSLASHASGFAYGGLSGGIPNGPEPNQPIIQKSMRLYRDLAADLASETAMDVQLQDRPALRVALNDEEAKTLSQHLAWQQAQPGYKVEWIGHDDCLKIEPRLHPDVVGGLHILGGLDVEPYRLTLAMAQAAEKRGATVRGGEVTGIVRDGGRITGVTLSNETVAADTVVFALGPWSAKVGEWTGVSVPVHPLKGQIIRLKAPGEPYAYSIGHLKNYAMSKPADDYVWCGTTEEEAGFDESKTTEARDNIIDSTLLMLPSLADADLALQTACLRPVTPDNVLMLGAMPGFDNAYLTTGGGRQGIMMGPGMGKVIADLIVNGTTDVDLAAYDPGRFTR